MSKLKFWHTFFVSVIMFKKINWSSTLITASIAATLYCVPALAYIVMADYTQSWILFLGAGLFFFTMAYHTYSESTRRGGNESTVALVFDSHVTTVVAIIISCIVCFILLSFLIPGYLSAGDAGKALVNEPPNDQQGKADSLGFKVFVGATILCFAGGSIAGITVPFYAKRNQTKDNKEPVPLKQREGDIQTRKV